MSRSTTIILSIVTVIFVVALFWTFRPDVRRVEVDDSASRTSTKSQLAEDPGKIRTEGGPAIDPVSMAGHLLVN